MGRSDDLSCEDDGNGDEGAGAGGPGGDPQKDKKRIIGGDKNKDKDPYRPECDRSNPVNAKKLDWISAHEADAAKVASVLGVTTADILGLSALESGWGGGDFVKNGLNNFFSQHAPAPDSNGKVPIGNNPAKYGYMATYASYAASAQSFMDQYGYIVKGTPDPAAFAAALQDAGKYGINFDGTKVEDFVASTKNTINGLAIRLDCDR